MSKVKVMTRPINLMAEAYISTVCHRLEAHLFDLLSNYLSTSATGRACFDPFDQCLQKIVSSRVTVSLMSCRVVKCPHIPLARDSTR